LLESAQSCHFRVFLDLPPIEGHTGAKLVQRLGEPALGTAQPQAALVGVT
jgi:hypothetical protein